MVARPWPPCYPLRLLLHMGELHVGHTLDAADRGHAERGKDQHGLEHPLQAAGPPHQAGGLQPRQAHSHRGARGSHVAEARRLSRAVPPPILKALENRVSAFAYALLVSQAEESQCYRCEDLLQGSLGGDGDDGEDSDAQDGSTQAFRVFRVGTPPPIAVEYDGNGEVRSYACPVDFGGPSQAAENSAGRVVRLTCSGSGASKMLLRATCSCQFGVSWGVGFCRHILHVAYVSQIMHINLARLAVVGKWLNPHRAPELDAAVPARTSTAAAAAAPLLQAGDHLRGRSEGPIGQWGTDVRRKEHLAGVHSDVLSLGRKSDELCAHVHTGLLELKRSATELDEASRAASARPAGQGAAAARRDAQRVESLTPTQAPASAQPHYSRLTPTEQSNIRSELGVKWSIAPARPFERSPGEGTCIDGDGIDSCGADEVFGFQGSRQSELVGQHILCRWTKSDGGWWIGKVVRGFLGRSQLPEIEQSVHGSTYRVNFEVEYSDGRQYHALVEDNCLNYMTEGSGQRASTFDWFLLQPRDLHNPGGAHGSTVRPATAGKRGRANMESRKAPVAGPTSKQRKGTAPSAISSPGGCRAQPTPAASHVSASKRRAR